MRRCRARRGRSGSSSRIGPGRRCAPICASTSGCAWASSSCLRYLHRLGFVCKRPKKRLLKADAAQRAAFVREYLALVAEAKQTGAKIFFVDEAHFRADGDLRGKWVLQGDARPGRLNQPPLGREGQLLLGGLPGDRRGRGDGTWRPPAAPQTSVAFLRQLRATPPRAADRHLGQRPRPRRRRPARIPGHPRPAPAPGPSARLQPDFNADEAIWDWIREEVTANTCFGTQAKVREHVDAFFDGLKSRIDEVKTRCRTVLQAHALAPAAM